MSRVEILFATDGRSPALAAGDLLRRLVDPSHVEIAVLSAHDPSTETTEGYFDTLLEEAEGDERSGAHLEVGLARG